MASDNYTRDPHDDTPPQIPVPNIDDEDNREIDSEEVTDVDAAYEKGFGNAPDGTTVGEAVDEDEVARVKGLKKTEQKKKHK